jgi:hypothetical protein
MGTGIEAADQAKKPRAIENDPQFLPLTTENVFCPAARSLELGRRALEPDAPVDKKRVGLNRLPGSSHSYGD